ncbi:MAG: glycine--tRNA ligase [Opitutales bacterium]|nr:glycine--tRNA ligase [Opitutales bacterium]
MDIVPATDSLCMKDLVAFCKRKGFIFLSSELYGGLNGFFDYGPLGVELKRNLKNLWWKNMVQDREDMVGLDSSIILHPRVWKASGHIDGFSDPMVDCKVTKARYRADQVFYAPVAVQGEKIGYICVTDGEEREAEVEKKVKALLKASHHSQEKPDEIHLKPLIEAQPEEFAFIPSPATGHPGDLTPPRNFNLMFSTQVGAVASEASMAYLRPETAQGIFINFKNVTDSTRVKLPFGIAQIGKAFRNEITPRNFTFRSREFEQMEIEYFFPPDDHLWPKLHQEWIEARYQWHCSIGIKKEWLSLQVHEKKDLAHYAKACTDIVFRYPFGVQELEGIAVRGNFDLTQHQTFSGKPLEYFDEERKIKYLPYVIEPSVGVDRTMLALLVSAYDEDEINGEKRTVLRFHPNLAPIKAAVFPLVKNKPELVEKARGLFSRLQKRWYVRYDETGAIGRRYRRMDEIGTPWCITVDFDSLEKNTYTLRDRDTTQQVRLSEAELIAFFEKALM